jgi:hypothetical protein
MGIMEDAKHFRIVVEQDYRFSLLCELYEVITVE